MYVINTHLSVLLSSIQLGAKSSVREARVNARTPQHQFFNPPTKCHHDVAHSNKLVEMQGMCVI
jgi:hypothetical protein